MAELRDWQELPTGGTIQARAAPRIRTGGWRTGVKPRVELASSLQVIQCHFPSAEAPFGQGQGRQELGIRWCRFQRFLIRLG